METRCAKSRSEFQVDMTNKANELNALDKVITYLKVNVFPKWSKDIVDVVSTPYKWKIDNPRYIAVTNPFSTADGGSSVACRKKFATVFSKLRVLTLNGTNQHYLDPNDL